MTLARKIAAGHYEHMGYQIRSGVDSFDRAAWLIRIQNGGWQYGGRTLQSAMRQIEHKVRDGAGRERHAVDGMPYGWHKSAWLSFADAMRDQENGKMEKG